MSVRVELYRENRECWDELVDLGGSIYQRFAFGEALRRGLGQSVVRYCVRDREGIKAHVALVIFANRLIGKVAVSLPVCDHSGICSVDSDSSLVLTEYVDRMRHRQQLEFVEFRHSKDQFQFSKDLPRSAEKVTLVVNLPHASEVLWSDVGPKVRNLVRKGRNNHLEYRSGGIDLLDSFYSVYIRNLRDLGVPCYPKAFFSELMVGFSDVSRIHLAISDQAPVASAMTFVDGDTFRVPFAASLRAARPLAPNMFLYWHLLCDAISRRCSTFDFGRSAQGSGTYRFKRQWGGTERSLNWQYCVSDGGQIPTSRSADARYQFARLVWRRIPVALTAIIGPYFSRRLST